MAWELRGRAPAVRAAAAVLVAAAFTACTGDPGDGGVADGKNVPLTTPSTEAPGIGTAGAGDPYYPRDGNGGYDVTAYQVSVSYQPKSRRLDGDTVITARALVGLTRFNLDLVGFEVSSVEVNGERARFQRAGEHELVVTPATPLSADSTFRTRVRYSGVPEQTEDGALGANGWQISTSGGAFAAGQPHSATSWFPANDTPRDKATFRLIARVPDGWSVISNGLEREPRDDGAWTVYEWVEPNRVATYLTTIGIDRWAFERSTLPDGTPVVSAYAPGAEGKRAIEDRLPEVIEFLSGKFGPYPQSAAGGIYLNEPIGFSLETQGRPIYATWADLSVVVHELAHQWVGNSVSVRSWADICLNECLASYSQWLWSEAKEGANLDERYRIEVARSTDEFWERKLYDMGAGNEFSAVYDKGPMAIHALRRQIGDPAFDRLLKEWTSRHKDGNGSWPEFERLAEEVSGQNLREFFTAWFRTAQRPPDNLLYPGSLRR